MEFKDKDKFSLDTPCLILDLDILEGNLHRMQEIAGSAGKDLRPHAKTHKCSILARKQIETGAIGICAAKVSEAAALAKEGVPGILITGPVATPAKIEKLIDLLQSAPSTMIVVDHPKAIELLSDALRDRGLSMDVLLDIDVGLERTGVAPELAPQLARAILSHENLKLRGIQAYAGQIQHISSFEERKSTSIACLQDAVSVFRELSREIESCTIFSASGTGTFDIDLAVPEITELQLGSYACMDAQYMSIGSAGDPGRFTAFGPALRLLSSVVSANQRGFVTVDAGLKSLYSDGAIPRVIRPEGKGLVYDWFGDEYGMIKATNEEDLPPLGSVLELIVSHCDPTINLFDRFFITRGDQVVDIWPIDLRGCSR